MYLDENEFEDESFIKTTSHAERCFLHHFHQCYYQDRSQQNFCPPLIRCCINLMYIVKLRSRHNVLVRHGPTKAVLETGILNEQRLQYATVCYSMLQYSSFGHQLQTRVVLWFQQKDLILTIPAREWHHSILIIFFGETTRI